MIPKLSISSKECGALLKKHTKEIVHLRQQFSKKRFGLVFGAGIGKDLGFPNWSELLKRISEHPEINGKSILEKWESSTSLAQHLFQQYRIRKTSSATTNDFKRNMLEMKIRAGWRTIVHECLYKEIPATVEIY